MQPPHDIMLIQADARRIPLADETVDCVVTSPPYYMLRDYGVPDQIGLEQAFDCMGWATGESCGTCFICQLRAVFREVWRVLKPHGTAWVNMGDSYASRPNGSIGASTLDGSRHSQAEYRRTNALRKKGVPGGLKHKDMMCQPWRLGLALQADGWWLRSEVIWHKSNPMPESVQDRPSKAHETILLLSKAEQYFYDKVAVRQPFAPSSLSRAAQNISSQKGSTRAVGKTNGAMKSVGDPLKGASLKTVWRISTQARPDAHFATFPERLAERCILAGTSARGVCPECGRPWARVTKKSFTLQPDVSAEKAIRATGKQKPMDSSNSWGGSPRGTTAVSTVNWKPGCDCGREPVPAVVLDPFIGSGTTCRVAVRLRRRAIGLDLSHAYLHDIAEPFLSRPLQIGLGLEMA